MMKKKNWKKKINTKISKRLDKKIITRLLVVLLAFFFILYGLSLLEEDEKSFVEISEENPSWNTYTNKEYGFSIDFPADWKVYEDFETVSPTINIYIPNKNIKPPFDHFAEINNVSIFPKGLPTEAVIGQSEKTDLELSFESDKAIDYILENGQAWATYISVDNFEDPWKDWGFIWSKVVVKDIEYKCLDGDTEIELDNCNPFEGDEFIRVGNVNQKIRETQEEIIKTFKILPKDI